VASYDDLNVGRDSHQVTKTKHCENESADTQPEALVSHANIIEKAGQDFIKNRAETERCPG
jgi:hypothetical protein